jgi:hypothetical protein
MDTSIVRVGVCQAFNSTKKHHQIGETKMIDIQTSVEQKSFERQELETDFYSAGKFDGVIGIDPDPQKWREKAYRSGFLAGIGRHYDQKYQKYSAGEQF